MAGNLVSDNNAAAAAGAAAAASASAVGDLLDLSEPSPAPAPHAAAAAAAAAPSAARGLDDLLGGLDLGGSGERGHVCGVRVWQQPACLPACLGKGLRMRLLGQSQGCTRPDWTQEL